MLIQKKIRAVSDKYAQNLKKRVVGRTLEMERDDNSH